MSDLIAAQEAAIAEFLTIDLAPRFAPLAAVSQPQLNVAAIAVGTKQVNGEDTGKACIQFYVETKLPKAAIPPEHQLPETYHGVPTDVIESGRFVANPAVLPAATLGPVTSRLRPLQPGGSCGFMFPAGSGTVMAGTLGGLAMIGPGTHILSNNHVLANENALPLGSPIFQPGLLDGGDPERDAVAKLARFVPIASGAANLVDCAIALIDDGIAADPVFLPDVNQLSSAAPIAAAKGMTVEKVGRTTGSTTGVVTAVGVAVTISYSFGAAIFRNQIFVQGTGGAFSAAGDSGSVIVESLSKRATGLLFAGSTSFTAANPMDAVLTALGITLKV